MLFRSNAQMATGESVDWYKLPVSIVKHFSFHSDEYDYDCRDCKLVRIKTTAGVSGYFVMGNGSYKDKKNVHEGKCSEIMIRLNPKDFSKYITVEQSADLKDEGFRTLSLVVLSTSSALVGSCTV